MPRTVNKKLVCYSPYKRCTGCEHYHGTRPECIWKPKPQPKTK